MSNLTPLKNNLWWDITHGIRRELGETGMSSVLGIPLYVGPLDQACEFRKLMTDTLIERNEVVWQVKQNMAVKRGTSRQEVFDE